MSKYTAEQIMAEAANWVASGNLKLASILHEYAAHLATLQSIHPPAGVVSDEWVVVGYMWQRNYSNGGHSSKLFSSKWEADEYAKDGDNLPTPDVVMPVFAPRHAPNKE